MKYHVNPTNGEVGLCRAVKSCPFGDMVEEHYPTRTAAQEAYETAMKAHTLPMSAAGRQQYLASETHLSSLMDPALLKRMLDEGFVTTQTHPEDEHLRVLTYSKTAQIAGRWNDATTQARGLIIRAEKEDLSDAVVIERPWRKFFTLSQMTGSDGKAAWALGDEEDGPQNMALASVDSLDFDAPAEVTDKMDGSLGILYHAPDGQLAFATKGSFASDQAVAYTKLLRENKKFYDAAEALKRENPTTTFLFELVGRENQIVLAYEEDDITFTGAVERDTGMYRSTQDYKHIWNEAQGLHAAETMQASSLREALALPDRENREGVVVRIASDDPKKQTLVKFKQDDYLRLHRMLSTVSKAGARDTIRNSKATVGDLVRLGRKGDVRLLPAVDEALTFFQEGGTPFHQRLLEEQRRNFEQAILPRARILASTHEQVASMDSERFQGDPKEIMKDFAAEVAGREVYERSMLFTFFRARLQGEDPLAKDGWRILANMAADL